MVNPYVLGQNSRGFDKSMGGTVSFNKRRVEVDVSAKGHHCRSCSGASIVPTFGNKLGKHVAAAAGA
jgi:hypothetical protein